MKKEQQFRFNKVLVMVNMVLGVLVTVLFMRVYSLQRQVDGAFLSLKNSGVSATNLEVDLRNRGIIDGKLLTSSQRKPYSLEQMNQFKKWVEEHK